LMCEVKMAINAKPQGENPILIVIRDNTVKPTPLGRNSEWPYAEANKLRILNSSNRREKGLRTCQKVWRDGKLRHQVA